MPDRGKVIKGLECCSADNRKCNRCPYDPDTDEAVWEGNCTKDLVHDALELLEEREPVKPIRFTLMYWRCGNCRREIDKYKGDVYCPKCGRKVAWDD